MSARDLCHDCVKKALEKDGWTITHDPYSLPLGGKEMYLIWQRNNFWQQNGTTSG